MIPTPYTLHLSPTITLQITEAHAARLLRTLPGTHITDSTGKQVSPTPADTVAPKKPSNEKNP